MVTTLSSGTAVASVVACLSVLAVMQWGQPWRSATTDEATNSTTTITATQPSQPATRIRRPPHRMPPAAWHKHLAAHDTPAGPLTRPQMESFYRDGFLFIPEFYNATALEEVKTDVEETIGG